MIIIIFEQQSQMQISKEFSIGIDSHPFEWVMNVYVEPVKKSRPFVHPP